MTSTVMRFAHRQQHHVATTMFTMAFSGESFQLLEYP
jgi:hypothetical protein